MPVFPIMAMQRFDFKNSIIAIKLFIVMILNLYLTSEWSQSEKGTKVWFCAGCAFKLNYYNSSLTVISVE